MRGYYSYKNKDFKSWKARYEKGEIDLRADPAPSIRIDEAKINGLIDILFHEVDAPNPAGRNNHSTVYRLDLDAKLSGGKVSGKATAWSYKDKDPQYGKNNPRHHIEVSGGIVEDHWAKAKTDPIAKGTDWPMAHGPNLTGAAADFEGTLVYNLHDARLAWVAEDPLPSGRSGAKSRGGFTMYPHVWKTLGFGGYGAPIIADGKVFVYVHTADTEAILADPRTAKDSYVKLGLDPRALGIEYGMVRDSVFCYDAYTGKQLWAFHGKTGGMNRVSKGGMASTPCYLDGKVYVRGNGGLYCLDAETGEKIWQQGGNGKASYGIQAAPSEGSVVAVNNTLILMNMVSGHAQTIGINPENGSTIWHLQNAGGNGIGLPGIWETKSRTLIVLPRALYVPNKRDKDQTPVPETFLLIDPTDGNVIWESDALGHTGGQILVWKDTAIGNYVKDLPSKKQGKKSDPTRVGGTRMTLKGAKPAWQLQDIQAMYRRSLNVMHRGIFYLCSRGSGFVALDALTGEVLVKRPSIYHFSHTSHNWTWHVAAKDRIFTDGVGMWTTADAGMRPLPGRLGLDITGGYSAPTKPAIADGRMVMRLADKLVCYDLRLPEDYDTKVILLNAEEAVAGAVEGTGDIAIRIRKDGTQLISIGAKGQKMDRSGAGTYPGELDGYVPIP